MNMFPISPDHPSIREFEIVRPKIIESLKPCGAFSLVLVFRGAEPVIHVSCQEPSKFKKIETSIPYCVIEGGPQRY